jgi:hypothetical protein
MLILIRILCQFPPLVRNVVGAVRDVSSGWGQASLIAERWR